MTTLRALLPRFLVVVGAVPLVFLGALSSCTRFGLDLSIAALVAAGTFAAIAMAPSNKNAAVRAAIVLAVVAVASAAAALQ